MSNTAEGVAELFYAKLKTSQTPGVVIAQLYGTFFAVEVGRSEIILCNRLVKIFGKWSVYLSIIDLARKESFPEFPYGLIYKICKDRLEASLDTDVSTNAFQSLDRKISEIQKEIPKIKKIDPSKASKFLDERS